MYLIAQEATNGANFAAQLVQRDGLLDVGDHDLAVVGHLHLDLGRIRVAVVVAGHAAAARWQHDCAVAAECLWWWC